MVKSSNTDVTQNYFTEWQTYFNQSKSLYKELYQNTAEALSPYIKGNVLDVGSGGVFNYSLARVKKLIGLDLAQPGYLKEINYDKKIEFLSSDARKLPFQSNIFNCVIMQLLIHHLAEENLKATERSVLKALSEAKRVLRPGGKLLIVESLLPYPLELIENLIYPWSGWLFRLLHFPRVKQFSQSSLLSLLKEVGFKKVAIERISKGKYVSQFGHKIPSFLTPIQVRLFVASKEK